ncbi:unnamed protein product [Bursaphelenchus okinawaensis]|uniref:Homeobox domain-containing protein n=1 Tax=Bursaphelenchus okinawaensis TaxID=465554 RepID=A0A811L2H7_9BILA|nr:unnamed protein product [Bursaphelenchus okinawaensis]CAG9115030.1 unnamed protein product [Bursaphelenchus okinawaensis]
MNNPTGYSNFSPISPISPPIFPTLSSMGNNSPTLFNYPQTSVPHDSGDNDSGSKEDISRTDSESIKRRNRTSFSDQQLMCLEKAFKDSQYPDLKVRDQLCKDTKLPENKIQVWFKNRRAKHRKHLRNLPLNESNKDVENNCLTPIKNTSPTVISWTPETILNLYNPVYFSNVATNLGE